MMFEHEGYAPKLVSHGENFKLQPGETLVMKCRFSDLSGLSRKSARDLIIDYLMKKLFQYELLIF